MEQLEGNEGGRKEIEGKKGKQRESKISEYQREEKKWTRTASQRKTDKSKADEVRGRNRGNKGGLSKYSILKRGSEISKNNTRPH